MSLAYNHSKSYITKNAQALLLLLSNDAVSSPQVQHVMDDWLLMLHENISCPEAIP